MYVVCICCSCASGVHISVQSTLPTSAGLGSSAAFATCLATSLLIGFDHISLSPQPTDAGVESDDSSGDVGVVMRLTEGDLRLINRWSFVVEKIIHGRPSGIDNSISTYGQNCTDLCSFVVLVGHLSLASLQGRLIEYQLRLG